jgi:predicted Fe-Mo cluster-binding NifX family protein
MITNLAVPTDDGVTISSHFGQAKYYKILTVEDGRVKKAEIREKVAHNHGQVAPDGSHLGQKMIDSIADCQVLISGGMGSPVHERALQAGLQVILTRYQDIDLAVQSFLEGTLENDSQLIVQH